MKLEQIKEILKAEVVLGGEHLDKEIPMACGSDLMSDVLSFIKTNSLLLTGLTNNQVIRTAEMADIAAVCFVRGKKPQKETVSLAKEKKVPLLSTKYSLYEACGRLFVEGLYGCDHLE